MPTTSSPERPGFQQHQYRFAAHIRDPEQQQRPADVDDRRMSIYRDLFYNNVEGFVASAFPVLRSITPDDTWHRRIRRFFADHHCQTPYFAEIAEEFLDWLNKERGAHPDDPPYIRELAHYEWVELALQVSDADRNSPVLDRNGDLLRGIPQVWPWPGIWPTLTRYIKYPPPFNRRHPGTHQPTWWSTAIEAMRSIFSRSTP